MKKETLDLWYKNNDVHDFLHVHDLSRESLIVDIGSYKGSWLHHMNKLYGCKCIGVEPVTDYFKESLKLEFNNKCEIHDFGLTVDASDKVRMSFDEDASSMVKEIDLKKSVVVNTVNAKEFFQRIQEPIDVLQINAEGLEYSLIPYMHENNLFAPVKFVQIQFHDISHTSQSAMYACIDLVEKSGFNTKFEYPFVWYGAERKK